MALGLASTAYVLEGGRIRYHGTAAELRENPDLLHSAYLLRDAPAVVSDVDLNQPSLVDDEAEGGGRADRG